MRVFKTHARCMAAQWLPAHAVGSRLLMPVAVTVAWSGMLIATVCAALIVCSVMPGSLAHAQTSNGPSEYDTSLDALREAVRLDGSVRVMVRMEDDALRSIDQLQSSQRITRQEGARALSRSWVSDSAVVNRTYNNQPYVALTVDANDLESLARSSQVAEIFTDAEYVPLLNGSTVTVGAPQIWSSGVTGVGHAIAIVDTGVDAQHPFLADKVIAEACFSVADSGRSMCPNRTSRQFGAGAASPSAPNCVNAYGSNICNHGTHVAGIAAGINNTDTNVGAISGVAPGAKIIAIQVFHLSFGSPRAYFSNMIAALDWLDSFDGSMAGSNIASVNMSIGGGNYVTDCNYQLIARPIGRLLEDGVVTVIAAGNNGQTGGVTSPGCVSTAVTVAATTDNDVPASFSNMSRLVDVWAPGVGVLSSVIAGQYSSYSGTSMAAPHVAGAAALLEEQGFAGGIDVAAALTASATGVCRNTNDTEADRCAPRLDIPTALNGRPQISEEYVSELTATSVFVGFTSNICGYGDYSYSGGAFTAPRNGVCYNTHGITLGKDTNALTPSTLYQVQLTLTDPNSGVTDSREITFTTLAPAAPPEISNQAVSQLTPTTAFVGFDSNICGYGDYAYPGGSFVAPRNGICYSKHGITLGVDTPVLKPGTRYTVTLTLSDPDSTDTDVETVSFTTPGANQAPRILRPYTSNISATTAFVGFTSNICGYGDYTHAVDRLSHHAIIFAIQITALPWDETHRH